MGRLQHLFKMARKNFLGNQVAANWQFKKSLPPAAPVPPAPAPVITGQRKKVFSVSATGKYWFHQPKPGKKTITSLAFALCLCHSAFGGVEETIAWDSSLPLLAPADARYLVNVQCLSSNLVGVLQSSNLVGQIPLANLPSSALTNNGSGYVVNISRLSGQTLLGSGDFLDFNDGNIEDQNGSFGNTGQFLTPVGGQNGLLWEDLPVSFSSVTNSAPTNTVTPASWLNFTNSNGTVYKLPLYK
jgi:hypothetical protein